MSSIKRKRNVILFFIILTGIIIPCIAIILKNPLGELFTEKLLSEIFETHVEITNMNIGIITPTISISQLTVDDVDDESSFFIKTGLITIQYNWKEYFNTRTFYASEITVDNVEIFARKSGSDKDTLSIKKLKFLDNIMEIIDIDKTANQFATVKKFNNLHTNITQFKKSASNTIDTVAKKLTDIHSNSQSALKAVHSASDIPTLQYAVNNAQKLMLYIQGANHDIQRIENKIISYSDQISNVSQSENNSILAQDIYRMMNTYYHNPSEIALNISQQILYDIVAMKITAYQKVGHRINVTLRNLGKKLVDSKKEKDLYIGKIKIALVLNAHTWLFIETQNITPQIYTTTQSIDFDMNANKNTDDITIQGRGKITLAPKTAETLSLNLSYHNIPFIFSHPHLHQIQIQEIQGTLDGALDLVMKEHAQDYVQTNSNANIVQALAVEQSEFGESIALGIQESSPIDISVDMEIEKNKRMHADVQSNALVDFSLFLSPLLQSEITTQATTLSEQLQQTINKHVEKVVDISHTELDRIIKITEVQKKRLAKIKVDVTRLQDASQEKNIQLVHSYTRKQIKKDIEKIRNAVPFKRTKRSLTHTE